VASLGSSEQALNDKLAEGAAEAQAFAEQQKADAERTKRPYSQVCWVVWDDPSTNMCLPLRVCRPYAAWTAILALSPAGAVEVVQRLLPAHDIN
jgi:hypothetical protein